MSSKCSSNNCSSNNGNLMILACSGGSNVGQLSNQAAIDLTREGFGKMFCLAGIGARLSGFVQSAKDVDNIIAIDGCKVGCAKAVLEENGIESKNHLVLTDLDIEKNKNFDLDADHLDKVKTKIKQILAA